MKLRKLKRGEVIEEGDLNFYSQISIDIERYQKLSRQQQAKFRDTLQLTPPDYHKVKPCMIGKKAPYQGANPMCGPIEVYRTKSISPHSAGKTQKHMEKILKTFGPQLAKVRAKRSITQQKLADMSDLSRNYIGLLESGRRFPSMQTVMKIQVALKAQITHLVPNPWTGRYKALSKI